MKILTENGFTDIIGRYFFSTAMLEQKVLSEKAAVRNRVQKPERFVKIDNKLLQFGLAHLSGAAIKMLYLVIARYMGFKSGTHVPAEIDIPVGELRHIAPGVDGKNGQRIFRELMAEFRIPDGSSTSEGKNGGRLAWFNSIVQVDGNIRFRFNPLVFGRIKNPHSYTTFYRPELDRLKSGYAMKVFQVLRGIQNRKTNWHSETKQRFSAARLKNILGIPKHIKLDKAVIQSIIREINRCTYLQVLNVVHHSQSGEIEAVEFAFKVKGKSSGGSNSGGNGEGGSGGQTPNMETNDEIETALEAAENLTWTQQAALDQLTAFGVSENIALGKILTTVSKDEMIGFEDVFTSELLIYFRDNSPTADANTFLEWWFESDVFRPAGTTWQSILEKVVNFKNDLREKAPLDFQKRVGKSEPEISIKKKPVAPNPSPTLKPMPF